MTYAILDTSLLAHALLSTQRTEASEAVLHELIEGAAPIVVPPHVVIEFGSLVRKAVSRGRIEPTEAVAVFQDVMNLGRRASFSESVLERGFDIATRLGQSDTFDATGYAIAEALDGEFWTADRRFAAAAQSANLPGVRFVP